jgi:site-specific DNA-cytosine methylase
MLKDNGYKINQFLLSPNQFGIPNSRLRYYLIATNKNILDEKQEIISSNDLFVNKGIYYEKTTQILNEYLNFSYDKENFLAEFYVSDKILLKESSRVIGNN